MASANQELTAKLTSALAPVLGALEKNINNNTTVQFQELLVLVQAMDQRLNVIETMLSEGKGKKALPKEKKASTDKPGDAVVPPSTQSGFPVNRMIHFGKRFAASEEFRNKYTSEKAKNHFATDATYLAMADAKKSTYGYRFCWNDMKENNSALMAEFEAEYLRDKQAHEALTKQAQVTAEPRTPPGESK